MIPQEVAARYRDADPEAFTRAFGRTWVPAPELAWEQKQRRRPRTRIGRIIRRLLGGEVGQTIMLAAVLLIPVVGFLFGTPRAGADPIDAYTAHYAGTICKALDEQPTLATVTRLMDGMVVDGVGAYSGRIMVDAVTGWCPGRYGILTDYIAVYGSHSTNNSIAAAGRVEGAFS